jgi:hypothetical protein
MRPFSITHRWLARRSANSRPWRQNPWIGSSSNTLQLRDSDEVVEMSQQKKAIGTWEDEGGSVRTGGHLRC